MIIQEPVQAAIWHCLNHYDFKDAVFLAERLCSEVETDDTIFMLATSYYRSNLIHQAYWLLKEKSRRSPHCRFLQARCAFHLKKYSEAECVLTNNGFGDAKNFDEVVKDFGEIACFALQLIAQICSKTERNKIAAEALRRVLKLNPFMWQAFAEMCHLGEQADAALTFQITNTDVFNTCQGNSNTSSMVLIGPNGGNDSGVGAANGTLNLQSMFTANQGQMSGIGGGGGGGGERIVAPDSAMLSTPLEQPVLAHQQPQLQVLNNSLNSLHNIATPNSNSNNNNNNSNLNSSMSMLRGNIASLQQQHGTAVNSSGTPLMILDDTPVGYTTGAAAANGPAGGGNNDSSLLSGGLLASQAFDGGAGTPFRRQFKYLSAMSPTTPSFGVLPLNSPCAGDSPFAFSLNLMHTPSPQTLAEVVNQEPKQLIGKKMRGSHPAGIINRKDTAANVVVGGINKPAVFTQTGNITPRTPNNNPTTVAGPGAALPNAAVRRSSRLFSNAYSVKENNKSPNLAGNKFAQPRSPPRKNKSRLSKICLSNELIEGKGAAVLGGVVVDKHSKKDGKEKIETITSAASGNNNNMNSSNNNNNNNGMPHDTKVLLNNSLNSAQTLAHHVLALKKQSADGLMALMRDLGEAYKQLAHYQCRGAIKQLEATIPKHHLCTSWVQSLLGVAHYELRDYETAVAVFKRIHESEPHRLDCMEIYSSSLWHLQKEVELSALAQDLISQDKLSPVTWCVAGNCFSLHKEHETAIKFFKRAVQVDPEFVYSYTLLGHELVLTEELDKALDYFRAAVVRDPRHYNAWFGIGTIYSKQEKYELAELHYIKALKINPQNSVILVHIGAMQYFMQKKEQALQTLNTAALLDPKNPLARFHRGSIYFSLGKHQEALRELEELKEIVPKESVVFYLIGKIHKTLGNVDSALMHFSWATDLDPKGANNQIKDAFDSMSHPSCCPSMGDSTAAAAASLDADLEPASERSDDSTQAQQDINYDSDAY